MFVWELLVVFGSGGLNLAMVPGSMDIRASGWVSGAFLLLLLSQHGILFFDSLVRAFVWELVLNDPELSGTTVG